MPPRKVRGLNSVGRIGGAGGTRRAPGGRVRPGDHIRSAVAPEVAPREGQARSLAAVNRRIDVLEIERSHRRISETAYQIGRVVQALFERSGGASSPRWSDSGRIDAARANELAVIHGIEDARKIQSLTDEILRAIGLVGAKLLRRILGEGVTFAAEAAARGTPGERGAAVAAGAFRFVLEGLAAECGEKSQLSRLTADG